MTAYRSRAPWLAWLLALALLLAQTGAQLHGVVHGLASEWQAGTPSSVTATAKVEPPAHRFLHHLWGEHTQRSDCQLFDQLGAVGLPSVPMVWPCSLVPAVWQARTPVLPLPRFERFYSAQAPPVSV